ncbi:MAG TPA: ribose 5-phosphate isomerase B [Vicinamibacterales bacterium]|nr:ribose 5-phosphate isomerase B [Vicinamibacterales bacterium]
MSEEKFDIITEAEARCLPVGSSVVLKRGGHVTPLAADTLRDRRIRVVREDDVIPADLDGLAPPAEVRRVAIGSDHTGVALKAQLVEALRRRGLAVDDAGTNDTASVDYPDIAARVARAVARGEADAGIVIDGAGLGSAVAANKIPGVRAAMCSNETLARYSRQHNGCNVLTLGSTLLTVAEALRIVETWISTPMTEARYIRRLAKIRALEKPGP